MHNQLNQLRRGKRTLSYETSKSFTHLMKKNGKVFERGGKQNECESHGKSRQRLSPFRHAVQRASICPLLKS